MNIGSLRGPVVQITQSISQLALPQSQKKQRKRLVEVLEVIYK